MTSTITSSSEARGSVPGLTGPAVPTEPGSRGGSTPRRRRSRFPDPAGRGPAPSSSGRPVAWWAGSDDASREAVRDHATAVGLELVDAPGHLTGAGASTLHAHGHSTSSPGERRADGDSADGSGVADPVCTVVDAAAVAGAEGSIGHGRAPLLVVTRAAEIPAEVWRGALAAGAHAVLSLPAGSEELLSHLAELARPRASSLLVGVVGGCGGAGASSFAARLAAAAGPHGSATLIDADPLGGGTDLLVEAPPLDGIQWQDTVALGPEDGEALSAGLPQVDEVRMLVAGQAAGPDAHTLPPVLSTLSPLGGTVVVDLSPSLVPVAADHLQQLLVVVPATDHAVRAASRRLRAWRLPRTLVHLVVRRSGPLDPREVAEDLALPLAASFRDSPRGAVPLLDVRRRGADRAARQLMARLHDEAGS